LFAWFWDHAENDYGDPTCPKCGNDAIDIGDGRVPVDAPDLEDWSAAPHDCHDYACLACRHVFGSESAYPEEPLGWYIDQDGLQAINCLDSDAMVTLSPYYTYGVFCSPCVPGAVSLDSDIDHNTPAAELATLPRAYCFGHDWLDGGIAPYPVYSVATGNQIIAEQKDLPCPNCNGAGHDTIMRLATVRQSSHAQVIEQINTGKIRVTGFDGSARFDCFRCHGKGTESVIVEKEVPQQA